MLYIYGSVLVSALIWLWVIYRYDRFEPEPIRVLLFLFFAGGLSSSLPSSLFNALFAEMTGFMDAFIKGKTDTLGIEELVVFSLFVGINEEFFKASVTGLLVRKLKAFNEPIDALVYSMTVALGFAAYENIQYTLMGGLDTLLLRSLTSVPIHIGLAVIWGMGIARSKFIWGNVRFKVFFPYIVLSAVIHGIYDFLQFRLVSEAASFIIAFLFSISVLFFAFKRMKVYLNESPFSGVLRCRSCGYDNLLNTVRCVSCGNYLTFRFYKLCRSCGERNSKYRKNCSSCGSDL